MQPGEGIPNPPETQFFAPQQIVHDGQNHQPMASQQQIVYIDLNYRPKVNLRMWSYLVIGIGIAIYIAFIFGNIWFGILSGFLGQSICCSFLAVAFFMDAAFYKGKSDWQASIGQSNGGSITGMIFDILFGIISIGCVIFMIIISNG
mgnify:FL=1